MSLLSQTLKNHYEATVGNRSRLHSFVVMPNGNITQLLSDFYLPDMGTKGLNNGKFCVVPGSFNPLHIVHRKIFDNINTLYPYSKRIVSVFEISINRKDKGFLSFEDLLHRLEQFEGYAPVWVTNALFFFEKTGLVSQWIRPCFQVGYDTADRLLNDHGILGVSGMAADFVVYPRIINGSVCDMESLSNKYGFIPHNMKKGPQLSEEEMAISSSIIRNQFNGK